MRDVGSGQAPATDGKTAPKLRENQLHSGVDRKNWLFSNTPRGAKTRAILYSIVETAKENGLKPFEYIIYLLEQVPKLDLDEPSVLDSLMPWAESLPATCRTPQKPN